MEQIRNPRWEQKRTEGYAIVSTSNQTQNYFCYQMQNGAFWSVFMGKLNT
jgi:hypothetical protein